ncbi:MAG: hypothetical protein U1F14_17200 [Steroidobacteraceae bacterium]
MPNLLRARRSRRLRRVFPVCRVEHFRVVDTTGRVPLYIPLVALGLPALDMAVASAAVPRRPPSFQGRRGPLPRPPGTHGRAWADEGRPRSSAITKPFRVGAIAAHTWYKSAGSAIVGLAILVFAGRWCLRSGMEDQFWNSARVVARRGALARTRA